MSMSHWLVHWTGLSMEPTLTRPWPREQNFYFDFCPLATPSSLEPQYISFIPPVSISVRHLVLALPLLALPLLAPPFTAPHLLALHL